MFPGIHFQEILILLRDRPCWNRLSFPVFSGSASLAGQLAGIRLKAIHFSKRVLKITGTPLSRINSGIVSAWTVLQFIPFSSISYRRAFSDCCSDFFETLRVLRPEGRIISRLLQHSQKVPVKEKLVELGCNFSCFC